MPEVTAEALLRYCDCSSYYNHIVDRLYSTKAAVESMPGQEWPSRPPPRLSVRCRCLADLPLTSTRTASTQYVTDRLFTCYGTIRQAS